KKEAPAAEKPPAADDKEAKKPEPWDVNNPPGPSSEVVIDTDEGTWMSLDVSPKGDEIAFDLLGDIYTIPIAGGEAKALTHSVAWDMQPRFSPDGKRIAFTSDQGGGDNIWVMDRDGANPKALTKETFRLLNSPVWTPDGEYVAARKHFTAQRSLGAGEVWLYHRGGGDGLQMTKKANDQKDLGEPAFSPDGRYLYYSQDVTPGPVFEYNKDPNGEIFDIQRLDRETGKTERFVTGDGGAVRPTPSPDGKLLAFVRRVRGKSVLPPPHVRSGEDWPLYDGLDRDMQETWSIHGLYPAMAWTPDSRAIVFWAGGRIHRIDVASRQVADIPFHVRSTRKVTTALRFPIKVAPDTFDVKMLRWVEVSPKGDRVVYQALGHLWMRQLPNGTPRRLTRQSDHVELFPSFSRAGVVERPGRLPGAGRRRPLDADHGGGQRPALRRRQRPRLPLEGRRGPSPRADLDRPRRRPGAHPLQERERERVPGLARRPLGRLRRSLQRLRHPLHRHRQGDRHRAEDDRGPHRQGDARRRHLPALVGRLAVAPLVARPRALHPRAQGRLRLPGRRAGEAAGAAGERAGDRLLGEGRRPHRHGRPRRRPHRDDARRRGDRGRHPGRRRQPHPRRRTAQRSRGAGRGEGDRRQGQDADPRPRRRPLARRLRHRRHRPAGELGHLRHPGLRRHPPPRPVERHRHRLRRQRAGAGRPHHRAADL